MVKPMSSKLRHIGMFSGNTILGDGSVIMIVDPNGVSQAIGHFGGVGACGARSTARPSARPRRPNTVSLLVFRAGSPQPKAVPLSLVTRLEEIDCAQDRAVERPPHGAVPRPAHAAGARSTTTSRIKRDGAQPLLVFSDGGRSMGLVVDEIVDIVEDSLDIEVGSERPGVLGSAVISGQATEIVDVGHFLPLAFEDWFRRKDRAQRRSAAARAAGRQLGVLPQHAFAGAEGRGLRVTAVAARRRRWRCSRRPSASTSLVTDIEMPGMDGFELADAVRSEPRTATCRSSRCRRTARPRRSSAGASVGFHDYVAKFDRQSLIAALKEQTADIDPRGIEARMTHDEP